MSPLGLPSLLTRLFHEFHCSGCGNREAYRSRSRGLIEKGLLSALMLQPVRCDRCFHRSYIFRTVPVMERTGSAVKHSPRKHESTSDTGTRVA